MNSINTFLLYSEQDRLTTNISNFQLLLKLCTLYILTWNFSYLIPRTPVWRAEPLELKVLSQIFTRKQL